MLGSRRALDVLVVFRVFQRQCPTESHASLMLHQFAQLTSAAHGQQPSQASRVIFYMPVNEMRSDMLAVASACFHSVWSFLSFIP